jgi:RNA polymerase sigma-70 factor (family 1)
LGLTTAYNEKMLLQKVAEGDGKAFESLYIEHLSFLYRFILKYVKSPDLAEDLSQETFVRIWEHREHLAEISSFKNYLFITGRNITFNFLRKASVEKTALGEIFRHYRPLNDEVTDNLLTKEYNELIKRVLDSMPAQTKEVFHLCRLQDKSYEEVAALLGISRNTVKKHMVRTHKNFTNLLGKDLILLLLVIFSLP